MYVRLVFASKHDVLQEVARHERMAATARRNLVRVDDYERLGDNMDYDAARESFRRHADSAEVWVARLRRFAEVW